VDGVRATIARDTFGTPHVFAATDRALFVGYGWAVAEDRLFQLELNRRAARGTLSALFGPSQLPADQYARTTGYTDDELDGMYAAMPAAEQRIYDAYAEGINRYVDEVATRDPAKLPIEFALLGALPAPWTTRDSMAFGAFMVRRFGEIGGRELRNLELLGALEAAHGEAGGRAIFDDVRWLEDPDAPVTVPELAFGPRPGGGGHHGRGDVERLVDRDEAKELWAPLGVPTKLGSYAWVVAAGRSAERAPLLYGGPQMGFSAPEVLHEVQLTGGSGFDTIGMAFAGAPAILIGRNRHVAWTSTTATGDNLDVYAETPCDAGAGPGSGTVFRGGCAPLAVRTETIAVRGAAPVQLTVARSVHGPIVATAGGVLFAEKRAHWLRELETGSAFFGFDRARDLRDFSRAVRGIATSHNFLYVDRAGNIAYWQAGQVPVRPAGFDPRVPFPGDGSAEWPGGLVPMPTSVNPPRGWLANWNNKPARAYPSSDEALFGKQGRLREIEARLRDDRRVTLEEMRDLPKDIARVKGNGREARFLLPWLERALAAAPPAHPAAGAARAVLAGWSGNAFDDAVTSTRLLAGEVIFETWLARAMARTFADELGAKVGEATPNMLLHAVDFAETGRSGVPPSRDYFGGAGWKQVFSAAFDEALAGLAAAQGADPAAWTAPRPTTTFRHPVLGPVGAIPQSNRSTYAQIVVARRQGRSGESIFTLGQSGFVGLVPPATPALDPHFADQLPLYRAFEYKPQVIQPRRWAGGRGGHDGDDDDDDED
jgi:penicillin amidase